MKIEQRDDDYYQACQIKDLEPGQLFMRDPDGVLFLAGLTAGTDRRSFTNLSNGLHGSMNLEDMVIRVFGRLSYGFAKTENYS